MKSKKLLTLLGCTGFALILVVLPLMAACAQPSPAPAPAPEPIVLKAISTPRPDNALADGFHLYVDTINERGKGELVIDYMGGPDVIPTSEQGMAVKEGVVDMGALYGSIVLAGGVKSFDMVLMAREMPDVLRKRGLYDLLQKDLNEFGLYLIGQWTVTFQNVWFFTDKHVERPQELAGQRFVTYPAVIPCLEAMGCTAIVMAPAERYSAIERGVADGVAVGVSSALNYHFYEVCDYFIDQGVLGGSHWITMNLDKWNSLPKHLQDLLVNTERELIPQFRQIMVDGEARNRQQLIDFGMQPITFSPADNEWFINKAYEGSWEKFYEKYPELGPVMFEFLKKG